LASCTSGASPPRGGPFQPDQPPPITIRTNALCAKARASENLRPRADITSMGGPIVVSPQLVHTSDLFVRFNAICGGCHVEASTGNKHITKDTFATVFDATWLAPIKADDKFMPPAPNGKPYSTRDENDPGGDRLDQATSAHRLDQALQGLLSSLTHTHVAILRTRSAARGGYSPRAPSVPLARATKSSIGWGKPLSSTPPIGSNSR